MLIALKLRKKGELQIIKLNYILSGSAKNVIIGGIEKELKLLKDLKKIQIVTILIFISTVFLNAQVKSTGSVSGKVIDTEAKALANVSVTIKGPALQVQLFVATEQDGIFRFPQLPPGKGYTLHIELPGYKTDIRKGFDIEAGKKIFQTITMETSSTGEKVISPAHNPSLNLRTSKTSLNFSKDLIRNIPMSRDLHEIIKAIPGSVSDEKNLNRTSSISGGTLSGNQYYLEGISFNDPITMCPITNINIDVYEEVLMGIAGHQADTEIADGGYINIIAKSGGNDFQGNTLFEYFNQDMQKSLLSKEELEAVALEKPAGINSQKDLSLSLGGAFWKGLAWYFLNARYFNWTRDFNHINWDQTQATDEKYMEIDEAPHSEYNLFGKLTTNPMQKLRITATYNLTSISENFYADQIENYLDSSAVSKRRNEMSHLVIGNVYYVMQKNFFLDARVGYIYRMLPLRYGENALAGEPRLYDRYYDVYTNNPPYQDIRTQQRINPGMTGSFFADNILGSSHELRFGAEYEWNENRSNFWRENPFYIHYYRGNIYAYPDSKTSNRTQLYAYTCGPAEGASIQKTVKSRISIFAQDNLTIGGRLTFNLGFRANYSSGNFPGQMQYASADTYGIFDILPGLGLQYKGFSTQAINALNWINISPRIGFAFDILNDGKTLIKGSFARNFEYLMPSHFNQVNSVSPRLSSWYWTDINYDQIPDVNDSYTALYLADDPEAYSLADKLDTKASAPFTDEYTLGIEREIARDIRAGITFIYKHKQNILAGVNDYGYGADEAWKGYSPDSPLWEKFEFMDPGEDGLFGTNDDYSAFCYAELAESPGSRHLYFTNLETGFRKYTALQFVLNKRMSHNWQLLTSIIWSKTWGNIGNTMTYNTPNDLLYPEGRLDYDRPLNIKIQSSVILPYDFVLSAYFNHRSGSPWNRTVTVYIPEDPKYWDPGACYTIPTEEKGARRTPALTYLDLRIEKSFALGKATSISGYIDILNALGKNGYQVVSNSGGFLDYRDPDNPTYERYVDCSNIYGPYTSRIIKFGLSFNF